jgi:hypothetical protein
MQGKYDGRYPLSAKEKDGQFGDWSDEIELYPGSDWVVSIEKYRAEQCP